MKSFAPFTLAGLGLVLWSSHQQCASAFVVRAPAAGVLIRPSKDFSSALYHSSKNDKNIMEDVTHQGGNARYTEPLVEPARLEMRHNDGEEDGTFIDLATGDELQWNEAPTHARNNVQAKTRSNSNQKRIRSPWRAKAIPTNEDYSNVDVDDDVYHKGGNAHFAATKNPVMFTGSNDDEEDCEHSYIDFATGDELCWNDYDKTKRASAPSTSSSNQGPMP